MTTASSDGSLEVQAQAWPRTSRRAARVRSAADARVRPVRAADVAQARLFDEILQSEIAALEDLAEAAERLWLRRREPGSGDEEPPEALLRARDRLAEAHRLLRALRERFPHD